MCTFGMIRKRKSIKKYTGPERRKLEGFLGLAGGAEGRSGLKPDLWFRSEYAYKGHGHPALLAYEGDAKRKQDRVQFNRFFKVNGMHLAKNGVLMKGGRPVTWEEYKKIAGRLSEIGAKSRLIGFYAPSKKGRRK